MLFQSQNGYTNAHHWYVVVHILPWFVSLSRNSDNTVGFITEDERVFCAVRIKSLSKSPVTFHPWSVNTPFKIHLNTHSINTWRCTEQQRPCHGPLNTMALVPTQDSPYRIYGRKNDIGTDFSLVLQYLLISITPPILYTYSFLY